MDNLFRKLMGLPKGASIVYHTGLLMFDRQKLGNEKIEVNARAYAAMDAYKNGIVTLVQRRVSFQACEYIAQRL